MLLEGTGKVAAASKSHPVRDALDRQRAGAEKLGAAPEPGVAQIIHRCAPETPLEVAGDGYEAALVNFGYMANAVLSTDEAVNAMA